MIERIIFNVLAFSLFVIIFFKMLTKNDTNYVSILVLEAIGIAIGFIELLIEKYFGMFVRILTYIISVILPITIIILERKDFEFSESMNLILAIVCIFFKNNKKT